jgi:transposase-like protein
MPKRKKRLYSRAFKLKAIKRLEAGESASALALELRVKRTLLYRWRDAYRAGGELFLRETLGRPLKAEASAMALARGPAAKANDLAAAKRQIAELERKVGRQQLDLDFFKQALRHIEASRRPSIGPGATASSRTSKR